VRDSIRATDVAFRYGGEELAVLLYSCPKERAAGVAEKIRNAVRAPSLKGGLEGRTATVSIGVSTFPEDGAGVRALVDAADAALYRAKAEGRDRVALARPEAAASDTAPAGQSLRKDRRDKPSGVGPS
jgi:diguanylate cyclase (GGDEF)-like protein